MSSSHQLQEPLEGSGPSYTVPPLLACLSLFVLKHGFRSYLHLAGLGAGLLDFWKVPRHHPALAAFAF